MALSTDLVACGMRPWHVLPQINARPMPRGVWHEGNALARIERSGVMHACTLAASTPTPYAFPVFSLRAYIKSYMPHATAGLTVTNRWHDVPRPSCHMPQREEVYLNTEISMSLTIGYIDHGGSMLVTRIGGWCRG